MCTFNEIFRSVLMPCSVPNESNHAPQFKLDIRNAPIQEEEGDVDAALANVANTLRAVSRSLCLITRARS